MIQFKNRNGTAEQSPSCPNCGPWLKHWGLLSGIKGEVQCQRVGCYSMAEVGAHVHRQGMEHVEIVPLCQRCNQQKDVDLFAYYSSVFVKANYEVSCEPLFALARQKKSETGRDSFPLLTQHFDGQRNQPGVIGSLSPEKSQALADYLRKKYPTL